jgi:hypothetical protein
MVTEEIIQRVNFLRKELDRFNYEYYVFRKKSIIFAEKNKVVN